MPVGMCTTLLTVPPLPAPSSHSVRRLLFFSSRRCAASSSDCRLRPLRRCDRSFDPWLLPVELWPDECCVLDPEPFNVLDTASGPASDPGCADDVGCRSVGENQSGSSSRVAARGPSAIPARLSYAVLS